MVFPAPFRSSVSSLLSPHEVPRDLLDQDVEPQERVGRLFHRHVAAVDPAPDARILFRRVHLRVADPDASQEKSLFSGMIDPQDLSDTTMGQMIELESLRDHPVDEKAMEPVDSPSGSGSCSGESSEGVDPADQEEVVETSSSGDRIQWKDARVEEAFWLAFASVHAIENRPVHPCFWERVTVAMQDFLSPDLQEKLSSVLRKRLTCTHFTNLRRKNTEAGLQRILNAAQSRLGLPLKPLSEHDRFYARFAGRSPSGKSPAEGSRHR
jgi:hypothetical protein